jgi:hypothetical protein
LLVFDKDDEGAGGAGGNNAPEDIASVLNFDPFDPDGLPAEENRDDGEEQEAKAPATATANAALQEPGQPEAKTPITADGTAQSSQPVQPNGHDAHAGSQPTGGQGADELSVLRAQNAQMLSFIQTLQVNAGQSQSAQRQEASQREAETPQYRYQINPDALAGLQSENPVEFKGAIEALLSGVAANVHQNLVSHVKDYVAKQVPSMIQGSQRVQQQQDAVFSDFYGNFPELDKPELRPFVLSAAQAMYREGFQNWDQNFRNALGHRVRSVLQQYAPQQQQASATPVAAPPNLIGSGTRARQTRGSGDPNSPDAILRTLGFGD